MSKQADQVYQSFLVRCWLIPAATNNELPTWRFELRDVSAEPQKQRFRDLEQMKEFIAAELAAIVAENEQGIDRQDGRKGEERWQGE